jgi:hypothetical protein
MTLKRPAGSQRTGDAVSLVRPQLKGNNCQVASRPTTTPLTAQAPKRICCTLYQHTYLPSFLPWVSSSHSSVTNHISFVFFFPFSFFLFPFSFFLFPFSLFSLVSFYCARPDGSFSFLLASCLRSRAPNLQ